MDYFNGSFTLGPDAGTTAVGINGCTAHKAVSVGPTFGNAASGIAGRGYRTTEEVHFDPAWVDRANAWIWETVKPNGDLNEVMSLNETGLILGKAPQDVIPYPVDRFNIRRGNMSLQAMTVTDESYIISRVAGESQWFLGRAPASFPPNLAAGESVNDYILAKRNPDLSLTVVQRWKYL